MTQPGGNTMRRMWGVIDSAALMREAPVSTPTPERYEDPGPLLTPAEVADKFRVDPKTVARWASIGKLTAIRTPGGHRRFRERDVRKLLQAEGEVEQP